MRGTRRVQNGFRAGSRLSADRRGGGDLIEEMPAFIVVVLSVAVFFVSALNAHASVARERERAGLHDECGRFLRAFRGLDCLLEREPCSQEPLAGRFDARNLDGLNLSALERRLNAPHPFNVTVLDLRANTVWTFGPPVTGSQLHRLKLTSAITIATDEGRRHPGRLEVVMWL